LAFRLPSSKSRRSRLAHEHVCKLETPSFAGMTDKGVD
jgi:hypothetical protein